METSNFQMLIGKFTDMADVERAKLDTIHRGGPARRGGQAFNGAFDRRPWFCGCEMSGVVANREAEPSVKLS